MSNARVVIGVVLLVGWITFVLLLAGFGADVVTTASVYRNVSGGYAAVHIGQ